MRPSAESRSTTTRSAKRSGSTDESSILAAALAPSMAARGASCHKPSEQIL